MAFTLKNLSIINACGLASCYGIYYFYQSVVSGKISESELFKGAVEIVRCHKGAVELLGEPIEVSKPKFKSSVLDIEANAKGSKSYGKVFISVLDDKLNSFELDAIYLQIKDDKKKLLVIREPSRKDSDK